jgi:hypothetical protein
LGRAPDRPLVRLLRLLAAKRDKAALRAAEARLRDAPPPASDELRLAGALTNRMVAYVATGDGSVTLPAPHASPAD